MKRRLNKPASHKLGFRKKILCRKFCLPLPLALPVMFLSGTPQPGQGQTADGETVIPDQLVTKFISVAPGTQIQRRNTKTPVSADSQLHQGDTIFNGQGDSEIRWGEQGMLCLKAGASLQIATLQRQSKNDPHTVDNRIKVERGLLLTRLNVLRGQSRFLFDVPGATVLALDGSFGMDVMNEKSRIFVAQGALSVTRDTASTNAVNEQTSHTAALTVTNGHKVEIPINAVPWPTAAQVVTAEKEQLNALESVPLEDISKPRPVVQTLSYPAGRAVVFSPRKNVAAFGHLDGTISFWDGDTGTIWHSVGAHEGRVTDVDFSPDGHLIASGGSDRKVMLWDAQTGEKEGELTGHPAGIWGARFANKRTLVAVGGDEILVFDTRTAKKLRQWKSGGAIMSLAIAPDQPLLIIGLSNGGVQFWNWRTGELLHAVKFASTSINAIAYNEQNLLAVSGGGQTFLCDGHSGQVVKTLPSHSSDWATCFSTDGGTLLIGGYNSQLRYWDVASATLKQKVDSGQILRIAISKDSQRILTSGSDEAAFSLRNFENGRPVETLPVIGRFTTLPPHLSADRRFLTIGDYGRQVRVWDLATGAVRENLTIKDSGYYHGAYDAKAERLTLYGQAGLQLRKRDAMGQWQTIKAQNLATYAMALAPDGSWVAAIQSDYGKIRKYAPASGDMLQETDSFPTRGLAPNFFAVSSDGKRMIAANGSLPVLRVYDTQTWQISQTLDGLNGAVRAVALSDDGATVAASSYSQICLWDAATGRLKRTLDKLNATIYSLDFSPDGLHLVAAAGRSLLFWDVLSGEREKTITPAEWSEFTFVRFVAGGKRVVTGGALNGEISLWNIESAERALTLYSLPLDGEKPRWLAITPEGYFDGSSGCENWLRWRLSGSFLPGTEFSRAMRRPDRVLSALGVAEK